MVDDLPGVHVGQGLAGQTVTFLFLIDMMKHLHPHFAIVAGCRVLAIALTAFLSRYPESAIDLPLPAPENTTLTNRIA